MAESLYLLDGHAQMYRAYYAPFRDLTSPSGEPTRATYVFFSMLLNLIDKRKPTYLAMAMDSPDSTGSRRKIYPEYKTNREPPPDDFYPQVRRIVSILEAMQVPILKVSGYEADDILATISNRFADQDLEIFLVSKDKDLEQLITDRVRLFDPGKDQVTDAASLEAAKGYAPEQAVEVQTLSGDRVDNIPGINGVGTKTAAKLIQTYGRAQAVLEHADELSPKLKENIRAFAKQMPITRELVTLHKQIDIEFTLEDSRYTGIPVEILRPIFHELGFTRLVTQIENAAGATISKAADGRKQPPAVQAEQVASHYELINTRDKFDPFVHELKQQKIFAFDTETTALNPVKADWVGISISWQAGRAFYIPVRGVGGETLPEQLVVESLKPIFENPSVKKCGHNIKYDLIVLAQAGVLTRGELFDSMVASFLLDPLRRSHSMDWLAREFFDHTSIPISDLIGKGKKQITIDNVDLNRVSEYAAEDADMTWRFYEILQPQLAQSSMQSLFADIEMPLVEVLAQMERNGVALDLPLLAQMGKELQQRCEELTQRIHRAAGRSFNIDSTKQLAEVLFDEQGLPVVRKTKTGRSTDAQSLAVLKKDTDNPLPPLLLEYRELSKLQSTYVDSLPKMVCQKTGRVHASYNLIGAITGRLSSNDPNLQNIPIRTELGRQIRKAFIAGRSGCVLLTADYSQIELRLLAHYSEDPELVRAFEQDEDIHRSVAARVFKVDPAEVTSEQRSRAKAVNFGIIYGQSAFGLSRSTGMSLAEAQQFIDLYFKTYPAARSFIQECIEKTRRDGFTVTILGRRRPILELQSSNKQQRMLGERLAVNTVLQGSAADLIKAAMIKIHRRIVKDPEGPRMLIQVHDELVFEVPQDRLAEETKLIEQEMTTALPLKIPLKVDTNWGPTWLETKPV